MKGASKVLRLLFVLSCFLILVIRIVVTVWMLTFEIFQAAAVLMLTGVKSSHLKPKEASSSGLLSSSDITQVPLPAAYSLGQQDVPDSFPPITSSR